MKVKALQTGFFNGSRVRAGQVFEAPAGAKASWFVPLEEYKAPAKAKPASQLKTLSELAKAPVAAATDMA
jgi:hypothetical protein